MTIGITRSARRALVRCGIASGLLLVALAYLPVTSAQANLANSDIIVTPFGGKGIALQYSQLSGLAPVVANQSYRVITKPDGKAHSLTVSDGYSIDQILSLAGIPPGSFNYAEVTFGAARSTLLTAAQATSSPTSPHFPVLFVSGQYLSFADENPASYITGSTLVYVSLFPGPRLSVKIKASPNPAEAGKPVRFRATVQGKAPGETLAYQWDNGTGLTYGGGNPLVLPLEIPGTYYACATVVGSKGSVGISPYVSFDVTKSPKTPTGKGKGKK
jgi:hypothetical protein